jgi:hypothetical protein
MFGDDKMNLRYSRIIFWSYDDGLMVGDDLRFYILVLWVMNLVT